MDWINIMKKYLGIKIVDAEPMTSDDAFKNGLIRVDVIIPGLDGYKVVYEDGYESWSPKDVFEKAYKVCIETNKLTIIYVNTANGNWLFAAKDN